MGLDLAIAKALQRFGEDLQFGLLLGREEVLGSMVAMNEGAASAFWISAGGQKDSNSFEDSRNAWPPPMHMVTSA